MVFEKHRKAVIAQSKAIASLISKDFDIFLPIGDHLPFDLIAYKNNECFRIQTKYAGDGFLNKNTYWYSKNTVSKKQYNKNDFDYYAAYLPDKDIVIFPSIKFAGCTIATTIPQSPNSFYWFEDFLGFTLDCDKKTYKDFGLTLNDVISEKYKNSHKKGMVRLNSRKVERPSKEELEQLVWEKPTVQIAKDLGVSDVAIGKWCESYGINKPPRGFWKKNKI